MGCGSRAGKMAMHSIGKPGIDAEKCRGCKTCTHYCAQSAISIGEDHKARIDHDLCAGCGRCIGVCNFDAISNAFDAESTIHQRAHGRIHQGRHPEPPALPM